MTHQIDYTGKSQVCAFLNIPIINIYCGSTSKGFNISFALIVKCTADQSKDIYPAGFCKNTTITLRYKA